MSAGTDATLPQGPAIIRTASGRGNRGGRRGRAVSAVGAGEPVRVVRVGWAVRIEGCGGSRLEWRAGARHAESVNREAKDRPAAAAAISVMLIVPDTDAAVDWYRSALGAVELWNLGGVAGLEIGGAPFFLHDAQPDRTDENCPDRTGATSARIEVFVDDPDGFVARAVAGGATPGPPVEDHVLPWGVHRQGGFKDPFGHRWSVGDRSPLRRFRG